MKQRNSLFDNLKALLIFLVVFGHVLELFLKNPDYQLLYNVIYSFHMPAFVFIAGYFSKNIEKQENNIVFTFLVPYIVFNSLYQILVSKTFDIDLFTPIYVYWFLLSMFLWKIFLKNLIRIRFVFFFSIILSLYCGLFDEVSRYLSISRSLVFLPYFLAGYFCKEEIITKIKKTPKIIGVSLLLMVLYITLFLFEHDFLPSEILKGADSYNKLGLSVLNGFYSRIILLLVATSFIIALINLTPEKRLKITYIGKRTLVIYLFHPLFIKITAKFYNPSLVFSESFGIFICSIIAIAITWVLSISILSQFYENLSSRIFKIIDRADIPK
jgi:fucose 4-O-acetylase-like acetyltransferase